MAPSIVLPEKAKPQVLFKLWGMVKNSHSLVQVDSSSFQRSISDAASKDETAYFGVSKDRNIILR